MYNNKRFVVHFTPIEQGDRFAQRESSIAFARINNILAGNTIFPNFEKICHALSNIDSALSAYIRKEFSRLCYQDILFDKRKQDSGRVFNNIQDSDRKYIRAIFQQGSAADVDFIQLNGATHNMIVRFEKSSQTFQPTLRHKNPPSFYQICSSSNTALLYLEALVMDACMCHYYGVSDAAMRKIDQQRISSDKVRFMLHLAQSCELQQLSEAAQKCIVYAANNLASDTPYISFFSVFSIVPEDIEIGMTRKQWESIFASEYCKLWKLFQKWYYSFYGKIITQNSDYQYAYQSIFNNSIYSGQISEYDSQKEIQRIFDEDDNQDNTSSSESGRYVFVIISHVPSVQQTFDNLGQLMRKEIHQAQWRVIPFSDISIYQDYLPYLTFVHFMIDKS